MTVLVMVLMLVLKRMVMKMILLLLLTGKWWHYCEQWSGADVDKNGRPNSDVLLVI